MRHGPQGASALVPEGKSAVTPKTPGFVVRRRANGGVMKPRLPVYAGKKSFCMPVDSATSTTPPVLGTPVSDRLRAIAIANPRWSRKAQADLDAFVGTLDRVSLEAAGLPFEALRSPRAFRAFVAAGVPLRRIHGVGVNETDLRLHALCENAPPDIHAALDACGIPDSSPHRVLARLHSAARGGREHSLAHLLDRHEEARAALQDGSLASALASHWSERVEAGKSPRGLRGVVRAASIRGADWSKADESYGAFPWYPHLAAEVMASLLPSSSPSLPRPRL